MKFEITLLCQYCRLSSHIDFLVTVSDKDGFRVKVWEGPTIWITINYRNIFPIRFLNDMQLPCDNNNNINWITKSIDLYYQILLRPIKCENLPSGSGRLVPSFGMVALMLQIYQFKCSTWHILMKKRRMK